MARVVCCLSLITIIVGADRGGGAPKGLLWVAVVVFGKLHLVHFSRFFRCHCVPLKRNHWTSFAEPAHSHIIAKLINLIAI